MKQSVQGPSMPVNQKWLTMAGFVLLNTALLVTLRACSIHSSHSTEYLASTVVVFTELMKLAISLVCVYVFDAQQSLQKFQDVMIRAFLDDGIDILKLCLPAILYAIQNNLQYIIETAPLFQVLYQTKIVTTAIFFTFMLVKRISTKEWLAIVMLAIGVGMVESSQHDILPHHASDFIGMMSVLVACITSGFAGVYYEKVLKASRSSVWVLNIELSMMSFSFSTIFAMVENPQEIIDYGVFKGFNIFVFLIVVFQAVNGLVTIFEVVFHYGYLPYLCVLLTLFLGRGSSC
jgi:UDP-sugar transporter A1/2/3